MAFSLFSKLTGAALAAVRAVFLQQTPLGRAITELERLTKGTVTSEAAVADLERRIRSHLTAALGRNMLGGPALQQLKQLLAAPSGERLLSELFDQFGPASASLKQLFAAFKTGRASQADLNKIIAFVRAHGREVLSPQGMHTSRRVEATAKAILQKSHTLHKPGDKEPDEKPEPPTVYRAADSSNVYSFWYTPDDLTLYVQYQAPLISAAALHYTGKGKRRRVVGTLGHTVVGKANEPGPLYGYYGVPPKLFEKMQAAVSKGKFIWDDLRIRGTVYGHKFDYKLISGRGVLIASATRPTVLRRFRYIPRKAVDVGHFLPRTIRGTRPGSIHRSLLPREIPGIS